MQDWLEAMQWPAMVATIIATWFVGSRSVARRRAGFWIFLVSNILWIAWGWQGDAYALMLLQVALVAMNVRGMRKADKTWRDTGRETGRERGRAGSGRTG